MLKNKLIVLLHGWGRSQRTMKPLERHFKALGYTVYNKTWKDMDTAVKDIRKFIMTGGIREVRIIGHSLGGRRAIKLTREIPNISQIVLLAPPLDSKHRWHTVIHTLPKIVHNIIGKEVMAAIEGEQPKGLHLDKIDITAVIGKFDVLVDKLSATADYVNKFYFCRHRGHHGLLKELELITKIIKELR